LGCEKAVFCGRRCLKRAWVEGGHRDECSKTELGDLVMLLGWVVAVAVVFGVTVGLVPRLEF